MAKQAAAAAEEAQLAVKQSKLPLFHADPKKDQFTGDQWLEQFENSRKPAPGLNSTPNASSTMLSEMVHYNGFASCQ
jgi:hypothetical protein